jgi:AcrR family transcriptional regulator
VSGARAGSPKRGAEGKRRYAPRMPPEERREQLLDATLRLIAADGLAAVSMEAVAREAQIAKTVVYDAFGSKRELLKALFEREQESVLSAIAEAIPTPPLAGDPAELLVESLTAVLEAVQRNPHTWRLILLPADGTTPALREEVDRHRERLLRQIEPLVGWGAERLGLGQLDPELAAQLILGSAENAARLTLTHPRRFPPRRIAEFAADLLTALQRPRAGR